MARSTKQIRILLLGDSATGKHCYTKRFTHHIFAEDFRGNNECEIVSTRIQLDENEEVPIQILNVAGSQRGKTKLKDYFKNIDGCMIMFDVTRAVTYDNVIGWKTDLNDRIRPKNIPCVLLANKCDLEKDGGLNHVMTLMDEFCQAIGLISCFEISNKDNTNIEASMQALIREIILRRNPPTLTPPPSLPSLTSDRMIPIANRKREYTFKILVIGESVTGKTAFIQRYTRNTFSAHYLSTVGTDLAYRRIRYNDDVTVSLHIWDIAGQERFCSMTHLFYKGAVGGVVVFDVSKPATLTTGAVRWKEDFDKKLRFDDGSRVPCLLIGNKCDLKKEGVVANPEYMDLFCRTHHFARWLETSAKENINVGTSVLFLIGEIIKNIDKIENTIRPSETIQVRNEAIPRINSSYCCNS